MLFSASVNAHANVPVSHYSVSNEDSCEVVCVGDSVTSSGEVADCNLLDTKTHFYFQWIIQ